MLQDIINNGSKEAEIQKYLQNHFDILNDAVCRRMLICPKFKLGSEYECDFISFSIFSMRIETTIIELKLPNAKLLTKSNIPTKDLSLAISQVNNYMNWMIDNEAYFRKRLFKIYKEKIESFKQYHSIERYHNYINSVIIIGQREQYTENENNYRKNIYQTTNGLIEIIPYDRLIEYDKTYIS